MKKYCCLVALLCLILCSASAAAAETVKFSYSVAAYHTVKIGYTHGQGFPFLRTLPNDNYTTTDTDEIARIVDCVNSMTFTKLSTYGSSSDGVYLGVYFMGDKTDQLLFD